MSSPAVSPPLRIRAALLDAASFVRAQFNDPGRTADHPWRKVTVRPVMLKAGLCWQVSRFDAKKDITKNFDAAAVGPVVDELVALGFRSIVVEGKQTVLTAVLKPSGAYKVTEKATGGTVTAELNHDRKKTSVLDADHPAPFLGLLGFVTPEGRLKADRRDKFTQINEFLRILDDTGAFPAPGESFSVVDFGCGNAYLTFALYHRLTELGIRPQITGVDLKEDLIVHHREKVKVLGWEGLTFEPGTIQAFEAHGRPDAVVALHACDTATDDAIAQGIAWGSQLIVVAPCCHHNLQTQLAKNQSPEAFGPVFRYGLTAERQADLLTDAFRALLLRLHGYKTDIVQFVDPTNSPKNLMIRAVKTDVPAPASFAREYRAMKDFWKVVPYLETKVGPGFPGTGAD